MAQDYFRIEDTRIATPSSYKATFATTSTSDSERTMNLVMHNTPIGTITGYDMEWKDEKPQEVSKILRMVLNKPKFRFHYFDMHSGTWRDAYFYASNFNAEAGTLEDDEETWASLSFNVRSIEAI